MAPSPILNSKISHYLVREDKILHPLFAYTFDPVIVWLVFLFMLFSHCFSFLLPFVLWFYVPIDMGANSLRVKTILKNNLIFNITVLLVVQFNLCTTELHCVNSSVLIVLYSVGWGVVKKTFFQSMMWIFIILQG